MKPMNRSLPQWPDFSPAHYESKWQRWWEDRGIYRWEATTPRQDSFVIDTPPPTVSGFLHMGHVFSYTQTDFIARDQRMQGKNVFYPMGYDDNGLPTERLVEKTKNIRGSAMDRAEFVAACQEVVEEAEEAFGSLFRSLGLSIDWTQNYQTISPHACRLSQASFLDLAQKGEAYRSLEPTLWDIADRTALAQADIEDKDKQGEMVTIPFFSIDGTETACWIATTRPEYLGACVAVFCHPEDARYADLQGKFVRTPLWTAIVPVLADATVDPLKGTGLVMCCTFGDTTDVQWWRQHRLPLRPVLQPDGTMRGWQAMGGEDWPVADTKAARHWGEQAEGLTLNRLRALMLEGLEAEGWIRERETLVRPVKCAERSGMPLEILVTPQWFIRQLPHRGALVELARKVEWHPASMRLRLEQWIGGLQWDWCISRQRFFGVPFPVWYSRRAGEEGKVLYADPADLPVDPLVDLPRGYTREEVEADRDVMDTWATSAISPQLNSGSVNEAWSDGSGRHASLFPADLRPQAHEIIRTWAYYTLLKSYLHTGDIPWKHVAISGWCLAADKTKMSKSKGNVVTPEALLRERSTDVVRFWAAHSQLGADLAYSEEAFSLGKKFVNKLWNASKFVGLHFGAVPMEISDVRASIASGWIQHPLDRWILSRLEEVKQGVNKAWQQFGYCEALGLLETFFWRDLCDDYLEIIKTRVYDAEGKDPAGQRSAACSLYHLWNDLLRLFAPFVPHITEEIFSILYPAEHEELVSIHARGRRPAVHPDLLRPEALALGEWMSAAVAAIRKYKSEHQISLKTPLERIVLWVKDPEGLEFLQCCSRDIGDVGNSPLVELHQGVPPEGEGYCTTDGRVFGRGVPVDASCLTV